jgi:hypothetical protein
MLKGTFMQSNLVPPFCMGSHFFLNKLTTLHFSFMPTRVYGGKTETKIKFAFKIFSTEDTQII